MPEQPSALSFLKSLTGVPEKVVDAACELLQDLLGPATTAMGEVIADPIQYWKWRNRVSMAVRAKVILEREGVAVRVVPPSFLLPCVEAAGYTDTPELQEWWARLLVSGVKDDRHQRPVFVQILKSLGSSEAMTLREIARSFALGMEGDRVEELFAEIFLLHSLGLVEVTNLPFFHDGSLTSFIHWRRVLARTGRTPLRAKVILSVLGTMFLDAVEPKGGGTKWGDEAVMRDALLIEAIDAVLVGERESLSPEEIAHRVAERASVAATPERVAEMLRRCKQARSWVEKDGRFWTKVDEQA